MNLYKAMTLFQRVADAGSLSAAAADVGLSPTMIGNHLQALESHLGAKLFNRTTRQQSLTELGRLYYDRVGEILALVDDAQALAQDVRSTPRGRLRVTAPPTFAIECLIPVLPGYAARYPEVELDLGLSDAPVDLISEGYDAAIRIGPLVNSDLIARPLRPYQLMLVAAPHYLAQYGTPASPSDLARQRCLAFSYPVGSQWRRAAPVWTLSGPEGAIDVPIRAHLSADNSIGLHRAALAGLGIAMLPDMLVAPDLAAGRLVEVMGGWPSPRREVNLLYLRDRRMTLKLRSFIDFVVDQVGPGATAAAPLR